MIHKKISVYTNTVAKKAHDFFTEVVKKKSCNFLQKYRSYNIKHQFSKEYSILVFYNSKKYSQQRLVILSRPVECHILIREMMSHAFLFCTKYSYVFLSFIHVLIVDKICGKIL